MNPYLTANRRVLVIDDNLSIHDDFRKILGVADDAPSESSLLAMRAALFGEEPQPAMLSRFEVAFADQGRAGFEKVQRALAEGAPFAMAFVDMRMPPGWDGVETIEHLWKADPDLQVVICTAFSDYAWEDIVQRLGQNDRLIILRKPFDSIEAWQLANALTAKWTLQRQATAKHEELEAEVRRRIAEILRAKEFEEGAKPEFQALSIMLLSSLQTVEELQAQTEREAEQRREAESSAHSQPAF